MPRFGPESIIAYQEQGFLIVPGAASPKDATLLKTEALSLLEKTGKWIGIKTRSTIGTAMNPA